MTDFGIYRFIIKLKSLNKKIKKIKIKKILWAELVPADTISNWTRYLIGPYLIGHET